MPIFFIRLGRDRVGVFDGTKAKATVKQFVNSWVVILVFPGMCVANDVVQADTPGAHHWLREVENSDVRTTGG
jgi:hypothetical protein